MFKDYFEKVLQENEYLNCNYLGISKKEFPRWEGWKIIQEYREKGESINNINDAHLNCLVKNFYRIKYIEENF